MFYKGRNHQSVIRPRRKAFVLSFEDIRKLAPEYTLVVGQIFYIVLGKTVIILPVSVRSEKFGREQVVRDLRKKCVKRL